MATVRMHEALFWNVRLTFASDHAGLFSVRFSDSGDRIFVTAKRVFEGERVYKKVGDAR